MSLSKLPKVKVEFHAVCTAYHNYSKMGFTCQPVFAIVKVSFHQHVHSIAKWDLLVNLILGVFLPEFVLFLCNTAPGHDLLKNCAMCKLKIHVPIESNVAGGDLLT